MKKLIIAAVAAAAVVGAAAWLLRPDPLTRAADELLVTPAYRQWVEQTEGNRFYTVLVLQSLVVEGCDPAEPYAWTMDPANRAVVAGVRRRVEHLTGHGLPALRTYEQGPMRYALTRLTPAERESLAALAADMNVRRLSASLMVLDEGMSMNPVDGRLDPQQLVLMKEYFQREGLLPQLRRAIELVAPELLADFDALQPLSAYSPADAARLSGLSEKFLAKWDSLAAPYAEQFPPEQLARVAELQDHPVYVWANKARELRSFDLFGAGPLLERKPLSAEETAILEEMRARYPAPPRMKRTAKLIMSGWGPLEYAGREIRAICPRESKIKPVAILPAQDAAS